MGVNRVFAPIDSVVSLMVIMPSGDICASPPAEYGHRMLAFNSSRRTRLLQLCNLLLLGYHVSKKGSSLFSSDPCCA